MYTQCLKAIFQNHLRSTEAGFVQPYSLDLGRATGKTKGVVQFMKDLDMVGIRSLAVTRNQSEVKTYNNLGIKNVCSKERLDKAAYGQNINVLIFDDTLCDYINYNALYDLYPSLCIIKIGQAAKELTPRQSTTLKQLENQFGKSTSFN